MESLIPSVHPQVSEPLVDSAGFSIELWADWPLPPSEVASYARAANALDTLSATDASGRYLVQSQVSVDDGVLWVSVYVTGPGRADDEVWALADSHFHRLWESTHLSARAAAA